MFWFLFLIFVVFLTLNCLVYRFVSFLFEFFFCVFAFCFNILLWIAIDCHWVNVKQNRYATSWCTWWIRNTRIYYATLCLYSWGNRQRVNKRDNVMKQPASVLQRSSWRLHMVPCKEHTGLWQCVIAFTRYIHVSRHMYQCVISTCNSTVFNGYTLDKVIMFLQSDCV